MPLFVEISVCDVLSRTTQKMCKNKSSFPIFGQPKETIIVSISKKPKEETLGKGQEIEIHNLSNGLDRASIY